MPSGNWLNRDLGLPAGTTYRRARKRSYRRLWQGSGCGWEPKPPPPEEPAVPSSGAEMPSLDEIRAVIASASWTQSKGYENDTSGLHVAPHQYIVRQKQPQAFDFLRSLIAAHPDAYSQKYGKWTYRYLNIDGWRYWTISNILNRVELADVQSDPNVSASGAPASDVMLREMPHAPAP